MSVRDATTSGVFEMIYVFLIEWHILFFYSEQLSGKKILSVWAHMASPESKWKQLFIYLFVRLFLNF